MYIVSRGEDKVVDLYKIDEEFPVESLKSKSWTIGT